MGLAENLELHVLVGIIRAYLV